MTPHSHAHEDGYYPKKKKMGEKTPRKITSVGKEIGTLVHGWWECKVMQPL